MPVEERVTKICLFGEAGVGKTSLVKRFVEDRFDNKYITTIGTKVSKKKVSVLNRGAEIEFTLMIWDIMGQKGFRKLLQEAYFNGASAALGVCDITKKQTLDELKEWIEAIFGVTGTIPIIILANKSDLPNHEFGDKELEALTAPYSAPYMKTSAKTGENVERSFQIICEMLLEKGEEREEE